ncbi:MAG: hypothetical protein ABSB18_03395 [Candidatus Omnitrophota bacterium]
MVKNILLAGGIVLLSSLFVFAEETIAITTYYPSPYGSYKALSAQKMGVGMNYSNSTNMGALSDSNLIVEGSVGIGTTTPSQKLEVNGTVNATGYLANGTNTAGSGTSGLTLACSCTGAGCTGCSVATKLCFKNGLYTGSITSGNCP